MYFLQIYLGRFPVKPDFLWCRYLSFDVGTFCLMRVYFFDVGIFYLMMIYFL